MYVLDVCGLASRNIHVQARNLKLQPVSGAHVFPEIEPRPESI